MSGNYEDPWEQATQGPWTARMEKSQRPCHYCGRPAAMTEPDKPWKAHKACALDAPSTGPLGNWDGDDHRAVADGSPGCGEPLASHARSCAGTGAKLSCQLCPSSPTYWGGA